MSTSDMAYTCRLLMHLQKQRSFLRLPFQWQYYLFYHSADRLIWLVFFLHGLKCFSNPSPLCAIVLWKPVPGVTRFFCRIFHEWITRILCSGTCSQENIRSSCFLLYLQVHVILPWIMPNIQSFSVTWFYVIALLPLALGCGCIYLANRTC